MRTIDVDVWVRGTDVAETAVLAGPTTDPLTWKEADVEELLTNMLLAIERVRNPDGEVPPVTLRGFSWIVSPHPDGMLVHIEMPSGAASAGPFAVDEASLTSLIARVMTQASAQTITVH